MNREEALIVCLKFRKPEDEDAKQHMESVIDMIFNGIENSVCKNCDYGGKDLDEKYYCNEGVVEHWKGINNFDDFGCNKFKERQDG